MAKILSYTIHKHFNAEPVWHGVQAGVEHPGDDPDRDPGGDGD